MGVMVAIPPKKILSIDTPKKKILSIDAPKKTLSIERKEESVLKEAKDPTVGWKDLLARALRGQAVLEYGTHRTIFMQGQPADSLYYLQRGMVRLSVISAEGKEAIVATLGDGEFFGEGCLGGQTMRTGTAVSMGDCTLIRLERPAMARMLHDEPGFAEMFVTHLLVRNMRYEADLVDQYFNTSEKRLARILLQLSHFGSESQTETVDPEINQKHLAQMVGTTRARISHFMTKFRKLGFVDYTGEDGLKVHRGLLSVVSTE